VFKESNWIGVPKAELERCHILHGDLNGRFAYFRCVFNAPEGAQLSIDISANSRYRLWVNAAPVLSGPCKGDRHRHYYETVDVSEYLIEGTNALAIQVLFTDPDTVSSQADERTPLLTIASLPTEHKLCVEGNILDIEGSSYSSVTTGKVSWKVWLDGSYYLKSRDINVNLGSICEDVDFSMIPSMWKTPDFDDTAWPEAISKDSVVQSAFDEGVGFYPKYCITERPIPLLEEQPIELSDKQIVKGYSVAKGFGKKLSLTVSANQKFTYLFDAAEIMNAYMAYRFEGGKGSKIKFSYFEKFSTPNADNQPGTIAPVMRRSDYKNGVISDAVTDNILLSGGSTTFEPFWFRTFRFILLEIETAGEELTLYRPVARKTGYPLVVETQVESSEKWVSKLWDICIRTLRNCMIETYMDCPFYEQMQFSMDTRLQMLFTYAVSADTRLARKALTDFHHSMIPDGLIQGKYPSAFPQIISTFSLHYIFMLLEYYEQTGDDSVLRLYRSDVDAILAYYDRHIGTLGLVEKLGYWEFVDWQEAWLGGVPTAALSGPSTIINLMYAYALGCAAKINEASERTALSEEYRERRQSILDKIQSLCWDDNKKLYREGPETIQFSQHAQAWAVLCGLAQGDAGKTLLTHTFDMPEIIKCSFSTGYELFRALELTGCYHLTELLMQKWTGLIELDCTCCPEEPFGGRSDCHAWSALPIYEFVRCVAGIRSGAPGWNSVVVQPHLSYLMDIHGQVVTPKGLITFEYTKDKGGSGNETKYRIRLPKGLEGVFIHSGGRETRISSGNNYIN